MPRPLSITIIAWYLMLASVFSIFSLFFLSESNEIAQQMFAFSPLGVTGQKIYGAVLALLNIAFGYGFLKGKDWARIGYVVTAVFGLVFSWIVFFNVPFGRTILIGGLPWLVLILFFLFRPAANRFFGRSWLGGADAPRN